MSATFGSPVAAVLLAVELLLFEYRVRSLVPVAPASSAACGARLVLIGGPARIHHVAAPGGSALVIDVAMGVVLGFCSMLVTRAVYAVEDAFEKLPVQLDVVARDWRRRRRRRRLRVAAHDGRWL